MILKHFVGGIYAVNAYLLADEDSKEAIVVDPSGKIDEILEEIKTNDLSLKYIVLTHAHGDHMCALKEILSKTNTHLLINENDKDLLLDSQNNLSYRICKELIELEADRYLKDGEIIKLGSKEIKIIETPGHTKGSMCLLCEDILITGDTLFAGSIGRSDLYGGDFDELDESLNKLAKLDDEIKVFPGHGGFSTIGREKQVNPFMKGK